MLEEEFDGLENQLFNWDGWDDNGTMDLIFYKVELKVPIGEFPVGTKFSSAYFQGNRSQLSLFDDNEVEHIFKLNLSVGEKLRTIDTKESE